MLIRVVQTMDALHCAPFRVHVWDFVTDHQHLFFFFVFSTLRWLIQITPLFNLI